MEINKKELENVNDTRNVKNIKREVYFHYVILIVFSLKKKRKRECLFMDKTFTFGTLMNILNYGNSSIFYLIISTNGYIYIIKSMVMCS